MGEQEKGLGVGQEGAGMHCLASLREGEQEAAAAPSMGSSHQYRQQSHRQDLCLRVWVEGMSPKLRLLVLPIRLATMGCLALPEE